MNILSKGFNVVISAPSGVGKSTLINKLIELDNEIIFSVSVTTRAKRPNEVDGVDYYFKPKEEFYVMIKEGLFIEYAEVFGNFYGTLMSNNEIQQGKVVLFDLDWQGASLIKNNISDDTITIFILPPSMEVLSERLRTRNLDNEETILYRLAKARSDITHYTQYDYIVVNDNFDQAVDDVLAIIKSYKLKSNRLINIQDYVSAL